MQDMTAFGAEIAHIRIFDAARTREMHQVSG
jgi:hypothetical protein